MSSIIEGDVNLRSDSDSPRQSHAPAQGIRRGSRTRWLSDSDDEPAYAGGVQQVREQAHGGSDDDEIMETASLARSEEHDPGTEERALIRDAIVTCYREVWREFYDWEPCDSLQTLRSLSAVTTPAQPLYDLEDGDWCLQAGRNAFQDTSTHSNDAAFEVYEWDANGALSEYTVTPAVVPPSTLGVTPYPRYEACTPIYTCIDPESSSSAPKCHFIKYAGQPGFDENGYLRKFHSISWQQPWRDPDHRVIASITVQRLTAWATENTPTPVPIYVDDIDDSQVFQQSRSSSPAAEDCDVSWIIHIMRQRDELFWPGDTFGKDAIYKYKSVWRDPRRSNDGGRIAAVAAAFCPEMDCLRASCFEHPYPTGWTPLTSNAANKAREEFLKEEPQPCGSSCYLAANWRDFHGTIDWNTEAELDILDLVLSLHPNTLPCSLKTILPSTDCYKIFGRRCQKDKAKDPKPEPEREATPSPLFQDDCRVLVNFTIPTRCQHEGSCSSDTCPCFAANVHCRRNCQCGRRCKRRIEGCKCGKNIVLGGLNDDHQNCACKEMLRECDPEKCKHAKTIMRTKRISTAARPKCDNFDMQLQTSASLAVRRGLYGLGTFAKTNIKKEQFIGEYIGDLFDRADADHRQIVEKWSKLNYSFELNEHQIIDAVYAGNATRYINHAVGPKANVEAFSKLVNGKQKVGFIALKSIAAGTELFFDYGKNYWQNLN